MLKSAFLQMADKLGVVEEAVKVLDPYEFLFKYAYTLDPHDSNNPVKLFPDHKYLRDLTEIFLREKLIAVVKSRQLLVTWLFCALHVWLCAYNKGQYVFFISRKEADAGFDTPLSLCSRALFICSKLPPEIRPEWNKTLSPPILRFPKTLSVIHGVSQDSDALRQYTASSVFSDEMAFQERAEEAYAAIKPTIDGGGRLVIVSTPNGKRNLFYRIIQGTQMTESEATS